MQSLLGDRFRYLLDVFEYDQSLYPGPPHCVKLDEIKKLYGNCLTFKTTHVYLSLSQREILFFLFFSTIKRTKMQNSNDRFGASRLACSSGTSASRGQQTIRKRLSFEQPLTRPVKTTNKLCGCVKLKVFLYQLLE